MTRARNMPTTPASAPRLAIFRRGTELPVQEPIRLFQPPLVNALQV